MRPPATVMSSRRCGSSRAGELHEAAGACAAAAAASPRATAGTRPPRARSPPRSARRRRGRTARSRRAARARGDAELGVACDAVQVPEAGAHAAADVAAADCGASRGGDAVAGRARRRSCSRAASECFTSPSKPIEKSSSAARSPASPPIAAWSANTPSAASGSDILETLVRKAGLEELEPTRRSRSVAGRSCRSSRCPSRSSATTFRRRRRPPRRRRRRGPCAPCARA